jgi:hypothetical protein
MLFGKSVGAAVVFSLAAAMAQSGATITRTFLVGLGSTETAQTAVVNLISARIDRAFVDSGGAPTDNRSQDKLPRRRGHGCLPRQPARAVCLSVADLPAPVHCAREQAYRRGVVLPATACLA